MKKLLIILDPAHGEEVPGKRSPDDAHREYRWSREREKEIAVALTELGYTVVTTNETDKEIGLTARKNAANALAAQHPQLVPFLISLHNDAKGDGSTWENARGVSVWTSRGRTNSDIFAHYFINNIPVNLPQAKQRIYSPTYLEEDFENDFTVLMGKYVAILIELMFQDNRDDVELLQSGAFCGQVVTWVVESIEACNDFVTQKLTK